MDDKAYSATRASNETAPTPPTGSLAVSASGSSDSSKFSNCYFVISNNTSWSLYNAGGHLLQSGTSSSTSFSFEHDALNPGNPNSAKINWSITGCTYTLTNGAISGISGSWSNNDTSVKRGSQSGSFEASSGGGIDPETASASA
jgi:hypothetical protein